MSFPGLVPLTICLTWTYDVLAQVPSGLCVASLMVASLMAASDTSTPMAARARLKSCEPLLQVDVVTLNRIKKAAMEVVMDVIPEYIQVLMLG